MRSRRSLLFFAPLLLLGCSETQTAYEEHEVAVETLTLSEVYGNPPKVAATLTGWAGVCERLETRQRLRDRMFRLSVVAIYEGSADAACPAIAQEYHQTVILELSESGVYTVTAGDQRATFELPSDYQPSTIEAEITSVDLVLRETDPVQVVVYFTAYYGNCDDSFYRDISRQREGDTFFITVSVLGSIPPEVPPCPPIAIPFTEQVMLETADLAPGAYLVSVNGVEETFTLK